MKIKKSARSKAFNSKLAAYSATATAALLVAPAANGTIENLTELNVNHGLLFSGGTPPYVTGNPPNTSNLVLFTAATVDETLSFGDYFRVKRLTNEVPQYGVANIGGYVATHGGVASRLAFGSDIADKNFPNFSHPLASRNSLGATKGDFLPNGAGGTKTGYVGFKTNLHGQTYYGWLHVKVTNDADGYPFEVSLVSKNGDPTIFGAIENAGDPNIASFKAGDVAPVPEPSVAAIGGLSLLALGAMGVREMRRRRRQEEKV